MESIIMTTRNVLPLSAIILFGVFVLNAWAAEPPKSIPDAPEKPVLVCDVYPGLASSSLTYARLSNLPSGVIFRADGLTIKHKDITDEIAKAPTETQAQLRKNAFYVLENIATRKLLIVIAKAKIPEQKKDPAVSAESELIQKYLKEVVANVEVSNAEVTEFYQNNKDACGGATLDQVKDQLKQYVLQQKQQQVVDEHIRTLGQRMPVEVSATWTKEQSILAKDNPVDKARASGKPSLVDFGSTGCRPCDMLAPILETLRKKYVGKLNVVFVHVGQEQILATRYGVQTIPMQFFYDKNGKEVFRHVGFFAQPEIEKILAQMGVE
jgi:thioredoxin 1